MFEKFLSVARKAAICLSAGALLVAGTFAQTADNAAKMKATIQKLGTGPNARIKLDLRDGRKVSGYVQEIKQDTFILVSEQSGAATEIEYADAKKQGRRLGTGAKVAIGIVAGFGALIGLAAIICSTHGCD